MFDWTLGFNILLSQDLVTGLAGGESQDLGQDRCFPLVLQHPSVKLESGSQRVLDLGHQLPQLAICLDHILLSGHRQNGHNKPSS